MWKCRGFADLLPSIVKAKQTIGDASTDAQPWPQEAGAVKHAIAQRQSEFITTRDCAREALQELGYAPGPILMGRYGEPVWPRGVVGSLTHGANLRAAAVALATSYRSIGIDVETNTYLPANTLELAANTSEISAVALLGSAWPAIAWDRLLFSAKEAIFKAWFPLTGQWLDFGECTLSIDVANATFTGRLHLEDDPMSQFGIESIEGRWGVGDSRLLTAVALPEGQP